MPTAKEFLAEARAQIGKPYIYGGNGPNGVDCSGLVQYCLIQIGIKDCPRTSEEQWAWVHPVTAGLRPGELIFEQWEGDNNPPGHVVIYVGYFHGGYQVIEAPHTGQNVWQRLWSPHETTIVGYGSIPGLDYDPLIYEPSWP